MPILPFVKNEAYPWKFFRAGGTDQVLLDSGADLATLEALDQKLWVALSCPTRGLMFDQKTLDLIDTDKDGRIRVPEIIAATKWITNLLKQPDSLLKSSAELSLDAIDDSKPEGQQLLKSARQILTNLGKQQNSISVEDTSDITRIFAQTKFNGDGIIPAESAPDPNITAIINDIIALFGPEMDRSGKPGVNSAKADQFFADAKAYSEWRLKAEADPAILPLGEATETAMQAINKVRSKVEDYFARCRLAAFDPRSQNAMNRLETDFLALAGKDLSSASSDISAFPLARIEGAKPLPLKEGINPAWVDTVRLLYSTAVEPLLGSKDHLTEEEWKSIVSKFTAYEAWMKSKTGASVEKLGLARIREILAGPAKETISALLAKDKGLENEANAIAAVDKLVRLHRDIYRLLNNFVNFRDFYNCNNKAIFQCGTLYLDQRSCDLCLMVEDVAKHATMAGLAGTYLAYCDCVRKSTGEKMQIVAAFTDGDSDNLMVGRNGIFYDRKGRDWDATIAKIIDNPISIRQAFWAPYKKFVRMIEEQAAKRAAAAEAATVSKLEANAKSIVEADKKKPTPEPKKIDAGVVAALGVGVGAVGTAFGYLLGFFKGLPLWQIPLVVIGGMLVISSPSMLIAWLKLRKRNIGPILDANGWAINSKARITTPLGRSLTSVAKIPLGATPNLVDPFAEKKSAWPKVILLIILLSIAYSLLDNKGLVYEWTRGWLGTAPTKQSVEKTTDAKAPPAQQAPKPNAEAPK